MTRPGSHAHRKPGKVSLITITGTSFMGGLVAGGSLKKTHAFYRENTTYPVGKPT